jgi:hypothetical protein
MQLRVQLVDFEANLAAEERRERRVPRWVAIARAVRRGRALWDVEAERRRALVVLEPVARDPGELEALARRHLVEHAVREAMLARLWELERSPRTAPPRDRGVLVSYCHFGPFAGMPITFLDTRPRVISVVGTWLLEPPTPDEQGLRAVRWLRGIEGAGVEAVLAQGCFGRVVELLRERELVTMAFDLCGSAPPVRMLGLDVALASGTARMAYESGAVVQPAARIRRRHRIWTELGPPLDARRFGGWEELHAAIAAAHDVWMRPYPWAHETPIRLLPDYHERLAAVG